MIENLMTISGHKAVISFDPEKHMFRGEFLELNGSAEFFADSVAELEKEGKLSLDIFLDFCKREGVTPYRKFSGQLRLRMSPEQHRDLILEAAAEGLSLNALIIKRALNPHMSA